MVGASTIILGVIQDMKNTRVELNCWLDKEDAMWLQRSCINWLQSGDRNTRFFYAKASTFFNKNLITCLMDSKELWQEDDAKIEEIVVEYYRDLFTS